MKKLIAFLLLITVILSGCSSTNRGDSGSFNPGGSTIIETILEEEILKEDILKEKNTYEIYLREMIVAENKIKEQLLQEDRIKDIILCRTLFIPEENLNDFCQNSGTAGLFGIDIDIGPLITKIAVGTGVIVTLVVLSISHIEGPVGSIVAAAAPEALKSAAIGTGVGTLFGGLTGAADEADKTERTSAILGFALAVAGLVASVVSVIVAAYTGGAASAGVVFGVKCVMAGISLMGTIVSGYNAVKKCTTNEWNNIDWNNIDWNKVGESAARQSIEGAANGYLWGSVVGAVYGGAAGLDYYNIHGAPYSTYAARFQQTPKEGNGGHWSGKRGESSFILNEPIRCEDGSVIGQIEYHNCIPDFSKFAKAQVNIPVMTNDRIDNFKYADELLAKLWTKIKYGGKTWTARDIATYRAEFKLTWHEMNNLETMQLVPTELNSTWGHLGGVGEYNALLRLEGVDYFD